MRKAKNGFIKNLHYLCLIGVIALGLMTIVGTGGGGGGTTTSAPTTGSLGITNNSSKTFEEVYFTLTTVSDWGSDQLTTTINPGYSWTLTDITPGAYDLRVVFTDGSAYELRDFSIVAGETYSLTLTDTNITGSLKIQNDSSFYVTEVYFTLTTVSDWGSDQLTTTINPGYSWTLTGITPGDYDLKVVYVGGTYIYPGVLTIVGGRTLNFRLYDT